MKIYNYVYKISNIISGKTYIGSRSSKVIPIDDLGITYFSSSSNKMFMEEQQNSPNNFRYEVLETFESKEDAIKCEMLILNNIDARNSDTYYNGRIKNKLSNTTARITNDAISYLGDLIKIARIENGISQDEMAERAGITRVTYTKIEAGNPRVQIGSVFECCFILRIPIMGGDENNIQNLSQMLMFMNKLLPDRVKNSTTQLDDNF